MYCSKCGKESADNAGFCSQCGNTFKGALLPTTVEIDSKIYTRGIAGGKYESLYSRNHKWFLIENGRAVLQHHNPWDRTHWTVRLLLSLLLAVIILSVMSTLNNDFNEGLKILTGIDFKTAFNFLK